MDVTFGCRLPTREASAGTLRKRAQYAEDLGFDTIWLGDHIVIPRRIASAYPYTPDGVSPFDPDRPFLEPLAALNFLAGSTRRIRLGVLVLIIPYRHPLVTAKQLATLDVLSGGRLSLGAGVGWMEEEFQTLGLETFRERGAVADEYLRLFKVLWTEKNPVFQGKYYQVSGIGFEPQPLQQPHPPIWIGGHTDAALRRAAQLGDGWMPLGTNPPALLEPADLQRKITRLRELSRQAGRPDDVVRVGFGGDVSFAAAAERRRLSGHPEQVAADLREYRAVGVRDFSLVFRAPSVEEQLESMERFARQVMPLVQGS